MTDITTNKFCPCCGYDTLTEEIGHYDICPICFWEDDPIQRDDPESDNGANQITLIQAQINFEQFGACDSEMTKNVRKPTNKDKRNPEWKLYTNIDLGFRQEILNFILGNTSMSELPRIGFIGLNEGLDSVSLCILAGMSEKDNSFQIEQYFNKSIKELNLRLPDKKNASIELAQFYADLIIDHKLDPILGVNKMIRKCFDHCDFGEIKKYAMDNIGFETVYGLYWSYDDLKNTDRPWDKEKTNSQLMIEIKEEIIGELDKWRNKNVLQHVV